MTEAQINKERDYLEMSLKEAKIPTRMHRGITNYVLYGIVPGDFLLSVIRNDLCRAITSADDENKGIIDLYVRWFYNEAPSTCWRTDENVKNWISNKGLVGE